MRRFAFSWEITLETLRVFISSKIFIFFIRSHFTQVGCFYLRKMRQNAMQNDMLWNCFWLFWIKHATEVKLYFCREFTSNLWRSQVLCAIIRFSCRLYFDWKCIELYEKKRRIRFNYKFPQYAPQAKQSMWRTDWVNQKQSVNQQHLQSELNKNKQFHSSFLANLYVLRQSYYYYYIDCKWA